MVPGDLIDESWTCYCVGANSDVCFDLELIARYGASGALGGRCLSALTDTATGSCTASA